MTIGKPFAPGNPGKPVGTRTRLTNSALAILADDVEQHLGPVTKIVRVEKPEVYWRGIIDLIKALLPRELAVTNAKLGEFAEEELMALLATVREMRAQAPDTAEQPLQERDNEPGSSIH